ncbi:MAG: mycothiol system anti-sigma-R factor [Nitriliruptor sp.]|nr:MAG: mycothiol system anti-sigma-R factor [Nitriliruptor sp.]
MEMGHRPQCSDECREALRRLGALLDGELGEVTQAKLEHHLAECEPCTDRRDFEEGFRELVRRGCTDQAPPHLRARILSQLDETVTG